MTANKGLLIFIKNPVKGRVKTRLAKSIGDDKALRIYNKLLEHTQKISLEVDCKRYLFYSDKVDVKDKWDSTYFVKQVQQGEDLGSRISHAFTFAFSNSNFNVIIGSDCLDIDGRHIEKAFDMLKNNDLVLGPAKDGGYYLLGLKKLYNQLFENIEWSSSKVLKQTLQIARELNLKTSYLEELSDIDHLEDLSQYKI